MKKTLVISLLVSIMLGIALYLNKKQQLDHEQAVQDNYVIEPLYQTEAFIVEHLLHTDGTVRTNFTGKPGSEQVLSESMGLWLEYLGYKEDDNQFAATVSTIEDVFLMGNKLVTWEIDNGEKATTNALIDDLRIIEALFREGERVDRLDYIQLAEEMSRAILKFNYQEGHFVDFHDTLYDYSNEELTLSYLIPDALRFMVKYEIFSEDDFNQFISFMEDIPLNNGFYPKTYDTKNNVFYYDDIINLIDQLYTAIHLEQSDVKTDDFFAWLKKTFAKENKLYGRYERETKQKAVDYEAAAVYGLTILYSLEKSDEIFAQKVYEQMIKMQSDVTPYVGGYVDKGMASTHAFDNLISLIAERIWHIEKDNDEK